MQDPNILLAILSKMAQKPNVKFDKLFPKLYNKELWMLAYESIATKPGNMTEGIDGKTIDGMGLEWIEKIINQLKTSRYKPKPVRRVYIPKANDKLRPIGIPCTEDKLLQTVVKLILEAIYEPIFSATSHGYRPQRSCHTALERVKKMNGTRWWIECDIRGCFDNLCHETTILILRKRINDNRFLHLIKQFLKAGYIDNWRYNKTYSGVPQGGNLSPILSNIYLNELDQAIADKISMFNRGKRRASNKEYRRLAKQLSNAKKKAKETGDWQQFKAIRQQLLRTPAGNNCDPNFRRMHYVRYADDSLIGIIGSKADAVEIKEWLSKYLVETLKLELSREKTHITNAKERIRFLGYDIKRWRGQKIRKIRMKGMTVTKRTTSYVLLLLMPRDKCIEFARRYGNPSNWQGRRRTELLNLSELEILMTYNAEIRGFLNYYALATNLTAVGGDLLRVTTTSFFHTIAGKRKSRVSRVAKSLKRGPNHYVIIGEQADKEKKEYRLLSSTKQLRKKSITYERVDTLPNLWQYRNRTELGQRIRAKQCEWCGTQQGQMEVHHVRKLKDLQGKSDWEKCMIARKRKTMVLCKQCHVDLHAGRLTETNKAKGKLESRIY